MSCHDNSPVLINEVLDAVCMTMQLTVVCLFIPSETF